MEGVSAPSGIPVVEPALGIAQGPREFGDVVEADVFERFGAEERAPGNEDKVSAGGTGCARIGGCNGSHGSVESEKVVEE